MTKVQLAAFILIPLALSACSSTEKRDNQYVRRDDSAPLVDEKYSLRADREKMEEHRREVPAERRAENDEMAYVLQLFQEVKAPPQDIRSKFDSALRKKREALNRDLQKERENFTKEERRNRDRFLKNQKDERDAFLSAKPAKDQREEFFKDQDEKRREFFSDEREKRNDYESDVRERRKSFEDYAREKNNEFNQEYRAYVRRYDEWKKTKEAEKRESAARVEAAAAPNDPARPIPSLNSEAQLLEKELDEISSRPGTKLQSGE